MRVFGFVFLCFLESSFQKHPPMSAAELKGKEFVQTIRKAELGDAGAMGVVWEEGEPSLGYWGKHREIQGSKEEVRLMGEKRREKGTKWRQKGDHRTGRTGGGEGL